MALHGMSIFDLQQPPPEKRTTGLHPLVEGAARKDVFLNAVLEMPTTQHTHRGPLGWAGAAGVHIVIVTALVLIPLFTTQAIHLDEYNEVPLVAPPPPPPPPPPAPAVRAIAPRKLTTQPRLTYRVPKVIAPTSIPKKISIGDASAAAPDLGAGVPGGALGGVAGGQIGGVIGGTGVAEPPPPSAAKAVHTGPRIVRVGSTLKAPRQTYSVQPDYPALARQTRVSGTVVVDAIIDERGNVVQAHAVSGHPLLIPPALRAVLQWKYEPTTLNGQPVSVELEVHVNFNWASKQE